MKFDKKVGEERAQFATQVCMIDKELLATIEKEFTGSESLEFYEGLLAAYAASYQIITNTPAVDHPIIIGGVIAYLSKIIEERS